jgi:hypothetical protein
MTPSTAAEGSDQDRAGDVARVRGDGSSRERNSVRSERGWAAAQTGVAIMAMGQSLPPTRLDARQPNNRGA